MVIPLPAAGAADILRAVTKDEQYITSLQTSLLQLAQTTLPNATSSHPTTRNLIKTLSRFIYNLLSASSATPGEEYAAIQPIQILINSPSFIIQHPTFSSRLLLATLRSISSLHLARLLRLSLHFFLPSVHLPALQPLLAAFRAAHRLHQALFYIHPTYHTFAERLSRVRYVRTGGIEQHAIWLSLLGILLIMQLTIQTIRFLRNTFRDRGGLCVADIVREIVYEVSEPDHAEQTEEGCGTCILCLGGVSQPALTACGHVFCWNCICAWCVDNDVCPMCRQRVAVSKLICLYNW